MKRIEKKEIRYHSKASEKYIDVIFHYSNAQTFETSIPLEYRRTGTQIDDNGIDEYLEKVSTEVHPSNWENWRQAQLEFWESKAKAKTTKEFFDILSTSFEWRCATHDLPKNPNFAKRIQDIKDFGFTLATNPNRYCEHCNKKTTHLILVPLRRGGVTGYETWSPKLRNRIIAILGTFDAYEAKSGRKEGLLPDHKFPEIRWDTNTKRETLETLTDQEIERDFQLLSNQRNQQKREVCRKCYQTGERGIIYGIKFFYQGDLKWDQTFPARGKDAENGCVGCAWYDIKKWRNELKKKLNNS